MAILGCLVLDCLSLDACLWLAGSGGCRAFNNFQRFDVRLCATSLQVIWEMRAARLVVVRQEVGHQGVGFFETMRFHEFLIAHDLAWVAIGNDAPFV